MIHQVGISNSVPHDYLTWAFTHANKNLGQVFGLAVDDFVKHHAMREGYSIPHKFEHFDLVMCDLQIEIKSTSMGSFTFSNEAFDYIKERVEMEKQFKVWFYINNLLDVTTTFIGSLNASKIFEANLFVDSTINPNQKYIRLEDLLRCLG